MWRQESHKFNASLGYRLRYASETKQNKQIPPQTSTAQLKATMPPTWHPTRSYLLCNNPENSCSVWGSSSLPTVNPTRRHYLDFPGRVHALPALPGAPRWLDTCLSNLLNSKMICEFTLFYGKSIVLLRIGRRVWPTFPPQWSSFQQSHPQKTNIASLVTSCHPKHFNMVQSELTSELTSICHISEENHTGKMMSRESGERWSPDQCYGMWDVGRLTQVMSPSPQSHTRHRVFSLQRSILKENRREVDLGMREGRGWKEWRERKLQLGCNIWMKNRF